MLNNPHHLSNKQAQEETAEAAVMMKGSWALLRSYRSRGTYLKNLDTHQKKKKKQKNKE